MTPYEFNRAKRDRYEACEVLEEGAEVRKGREADSEGEGGNRKKEELKSSGAV